MTLIWLTADSVLLGRSHCKGTLSREIQRATGHGERLITALFLKILSVTLVSSLFLTVFFGLLLLLLEFVFFLGCELDHALEDTLLKTEVFHRHIIHHLDMLLEQLIEVLDEAATRLLLPKSLPIVSILEDVAVVATPGRGTYAYVIVRDLETVQRGILLVELELRGH